MSDIKSFYGYKEPFSNFYPVAFKHRGVLMGCGEQDFQLEKTLYAGDATQVKNLTARPLKDKESLDYGQKVVLDNPAGWDKVKTAAMISCMLSKYSDPKVKEALMATGHDKLVEASPYDSYWGAGTKDVGSGEFKGQNRLGRVLMLVRDSYSSEPNPKTLETIDRVTRNLGDDLSGFVKNKDENKSVQRPVEVNYDVKVDAGVHNLYKQEIRRPIPDDAFHIGMTGHRPVSGRGDYQKSAFKGGWQYENLPETKLVRDQLKHTILDQVKEHGSVVCHSGYALGADTLFTEAVVEAKRENNNVYLSAEIPCPSQASKWGSSAQRKYNALLKEADVVNILDEHYRGFDKTTGYAGSLNERNKMIVAPTNLMLAMWDGTPGGTGNTVKIAKDQSKDISYVGLDLLSRNHSDIPREVLDNQYPNVMTSAQKEEDLDMELYDFY